MDGMTDKQYFSDRETLIRLILEMIRNSGSLEEAAEKVETLLPKQ